MSNEPIEQVPVPALRRQAERLLAVAQPAAQFAQAVSGLVGVLAVVSLLSGSIVFLLLFAPFESASLWKGVGWAVVGLLLIAPGTVLGIFRLGLSQLIAIPSEVAASLGDVEVAGLGALKLSSLADGQGGRLKRLLRFIRSLVDVRATLLQSKEIAIKAALLVRLANPITLVAVLLATALSLILVFAAVLASAILVFL